MVILTRKTCDCKKRETYGQTKYIYYTHLVAITPQDRSSRCRIKPCSKRSFPGMRTTSFLGFTALSAIKDVACSNLLKV